jgi:GT2 family glycosyltransferase
MTSMDCVSKYTNPDEFELIVVDPEPSEAIRDDYGFLPKYNHLQPSPDPGYAACMNLGAKEAKGEILVFLQNDVFVHEGWLSGLRQYVENGFDVVFPDQVPRTRQYILDSYEREPFDPLAMMGGRDAGLMMITKEMFERVGGWDPELSILAERDMYERLGFIKCKWTDTNKVQITHIMGASNWKLLADDPDEYNRRMDFDANKLNNV